MRTALQIGTSVALAGWLAGTAPAAPGPRLHCDAPAYDFGDRNNTAVVEHEFRLRNAGAAPLVIRGVRPDCGCTAATLGTNVLAPGASTGLKTRLVLWGRVGRQDKRIRLESNDPDQPAFDVWLRGTAQVEVAFEPMTVILRGALLTGVVTQDVRLLARNPATRLTKVTVNSPAFEVRLWAGGEQDARGFTLTTVPPLAPGYVQASVTVETTHPEQRTFQVPVTCFVQPPIVVLPAELLIPRAQPQPKIRRLMVRSGTVAAFRVTGVEVTAAGVTAEVQESGPARYQIAVHGLAEAAEAEGQAVRIHTDCPQMPLLEVPIRRVP